MPAAVIVAKPLEIWTAVLGTTFPTLATATPSSPWEIMGRFSIADIAEGGITISRPSSYEEFRSDGTAGIRGVSRTESGLRFEWGLLDVGMVNLAKAMNNQTVVTTAAASGVKGFKRVKLYQDIGRVLPLAWLFRGDSPDLDGGRCQYCLPAGVQMGELELKYSKGSQLMLPFVVTAIEDPSASAIADFYGYYETEHAAALA